MAHKTAELLEVRKKLSTLEATIKADTERLLAEQRIQLDKRVTGSTKIISQLADTIETETATITTLKERKNELEISIIGIEDTLDQKQVIVADLTKQIVAAEGKLEHITGKYAAAQAKETASRANLAALELEKTSYEKQVDETAQQVTTITGELSQLEATKQKYVDALAAKRKDVELINAKLLAQADQLTTERQSMEDQRAALSTRERDLQERDKNLRIREAKVAMDEDRIVKNYNLLNL